ncbi:MAG: FecR domain-containing protein [Reyranellaceae bacterium]
MSALASFRWRRGDVSVRSPVKQASWWLAVAAACMLASPPASAEIGKASVVQGEPKGKPPSETERVLKIGNDLQADERVTTLAHDRAHVVFLDNTSLTIGPNSAVVLDRFVFDPSRGVGEMSLSAVKGSVRFVGGLISKTSTVTVTSPTATMGIRGGIAVLVVAPSGATTAGLLFGVSLTVTSQGVTQTAGPNFQITVQPGQPPSPPTPIPPGGPLAMLALELGAPPSTGTSGDVQAAEQSAAIARALADSGLAQVNSGISPEQALASLATQQQAQWSFGIGVRPGAGVGQSQGTSPLASSGPLQGNNPLQDGGPLQAIGPLQAAGPLQGMGPLTLGLPLQDVGPVPLPENPPPDQVGPLINWSPPGYLPPSLAPAEIAALASGDSATVNQVVAQLLASGSTSPVAIQQIVEAISPPPSASPQSAIGQPSGSYGATSPIVPSGQLPPTVFQPTTFVSSQ